MQPSLLIKGNRSYLRDGCSDASCKLSFHRRCRAHSCGTWAPCEDRTHRAAERDQERGSAAGLHRTTHIRVGL